MTSSANKIIKAGVIGHPIGHSKSPLIHNRWIEELGLSGSYEAIDIAPDHLAEGVQKLVEQGFAGFNVTVPHKESIMALCNEIEPEAAAIGAVNTVTIKDDQLIGANTDAFGFTQNIRSAYSHFDFSAGPAVVLGAGGAARAVIYGLLEAGVPEIILTNRTWEKAEALAGIFGPKLRVEDWNKRDIILHSINLLINSTTLGMTGQRDLELSLEHLPSTALVNDIVYAPLYTDLLQQAKVRGNPVLTGIGMLLHQARPAFERWFGVLPEVTSELEKQVLA